MLKQEWGYEYLGHLRSPQQPIEADEWSYLDVDQKQEAMPGAGEMEVASPALQARQLGKRKQRASDGSASPKAGRSGAVKKGLFRIKEDQSDYEMDVPKASAPPAKAEKKQKAGLGKGKAKTESGLSLGRGGRPVTWFGGGGMNPQDLIGLGVPKLRALFLETFGHHTASNNGAWLRRKLCEKPDAERGRGRSAAVRKRDQGAAIWTTGAVRNITQAEAKVLVSNGPVLANGSFIAVHETSGSAKDAESVANSPNDTPLVTPTKHIQYKAAGVSKPMRLTYSWGKPSRNTAKDSTPLKSPTQRPLCFEGASSDAGARMGEGECGMVRRLLQQSDLADAAHFKGQQVELFWPEDDTWWLARIIKLNAKQCQVVYETGETEDLDVDELIRDGIMSLGWVPAQGFARPDSAGQLSIAGEQPCDKRYQSPMSIQIKGSPQQSTPGLTPELCQLINADVDVRRAASLDNVCDSSDIDTGDQLQADFGLQPVVSPAPQRSVPPRELRDLRDLASIDLVRTASTLPASPIDRDTQAWADNLLLTAHKAYAQLDRRRDGSQESCTTTGLHMLQQELGMSRQSADAEVERKATKRVPGVYAVEYRFGNGQPLGFSVKNEAAVASGTGPAGASAIADASAFDLADFDAAFLSGVIDTHSVASAFAF